MKTIEYKLKGTRRQAGAIGKPSKFTVTVSRQTGTMSARDAMDTARESMYQDGFDQILFKACFIKAGRTWKPIPMMEALGLE